MLGLRVSESNKGNAIGSKMLAQSIELSANVTSKSSAGPVSALIAGP